MLTNVPTIAIMASLWQWTLCYGHPVSSYILYIKAQGEVLKFVAMARIDVPGRYEARSAMFVAKSTLTTTRESASDYIL